MHFTKTACLKRVSLFDLSIFQSNGSRHQRVGVDGRRARKNEERGQTDCLIRARGISVLSI